MQLRNATARAGVPVLLHLVARYDDAIGYYGEGGQAGCQSAYWQYLYDQKAEWGPTYFDAKHIFDLCSLYSLPFGKGKTYGSSWNPVVNGVLGGWQFGGILTLLPASRHDQATDVSGTLAASARADVVGTPHNSEVVGLGAHWLDGSAYAQPKAGTFGNEGVGSVRGPGLSRFDMTLGKKFNITEAKYLELRGEAYGLTNTPAFGTPNRNITSSTFGEISGAQGERNMQIALKFYF